MIDKKNRIENGIEILNSLLKDDFYRFTDKEVKEMIDLKVFLLELKDNIKRDDKIK